MRLSLAKIPSLMSSRIAGESFSLCSWCFHVLGVLSAWQSYMELPEGLVSIHATDPGGKNKVTEFIYQEHLPPDDQEQPVAAPVQDARPKAVERPVNTPP